MTDGNLLPCPFRAVTGLPCPFCGATRAFVLAAHGDLRFLDYGAGWVALAAVALLAVLVLAVTGRRPALGHVLRTPRRATATVALTLAGPWAWALAHAGTIAGG